MKYPRLALAWVLYWIGHVTSIILESVERDWWAEFWYPVYNWCMLASNRLDRYGVIWIPLSGGTGD
jgi:hypothetical protein